MSSRRPLAQIATIFLIAFGIVFCICGGLLSLSGLFSGEPIFLPNGETANSESLFGIIVITLCLCGLLGFTLSLAGVAVWYLFGQEEVAENVWTKVVALLLLIGSLFFAFWAVLVFITGSLTNGMLPITGEQVGQLPSIIGALVCLVPSGLLACASLAIWYFFIRGQQSFTANGQITEVVSVESYISFMQSMLPQLHNNDADASIQARTAVAFNSATVEEKAQILHFLYKSGLIDATHTKISLYGFDLAHINLSTLNLTNINLSGADLSHADLHEAVLVGANFQEAILMVTDLRFTELMNANMQGANLRDARLHGSRLHKANLQSATLTGANFWKADLTDALLTEAQIKTVKSISEATLPDGSKV